MESFENLPPWLQAITNIAIFLATSGLVVFGYTRKKVAERLQGDESKDAVVVSAAFADSKIIADLRHEIDALGAHVHELRLSTDRNTEAINSQTGVIADRLNRVGDLLASRRD